MDNNTHNRNNGFCEFTPENTQHYFSVVLQWSYFIMLFYFICFMIYTLYFGHVNSCIGTVPWFLLCGFGLYATRHWPSRHNFFYYTLLLLSWLVLYVYTYGWDCGGQHFIIPLMVTAFFSIYDTTQRKLLFLAVLFSLRLFLFFYCLNNEPVVILETTPSEVLQILNTAFVFIQLAIICLVFSTNIQKAEKQLLVYNKELRKQACTDPLTTLHNRRYMMDILEEQVCNRPNDVFSVALGDIDWFKKINDTRGHVCGDKVLRELSVLFKERVCGKGYVCRWGGEEFFFFLPDMNLDEASIFMNDLNIAVSQLPIIYKNQEFHVNMTFGVEEYDYRSNLTDLIKKADEKLYIGKNQGRNQVVF